MKRLIAAMRNFDGKDGGNASCAVRCGKLRGVLTACAWTAGVLAFLAAALIGVAEWQVNACAKDVYDDASLIPEREYGLLLGTARIVGGHYVNTYFTHRINAAAELYHAGKIRKVIVSGDNSRKDYDEPEDMRQALREKGVADEDILLDYAGFRTLDSVVRARNVFKVKEFTVISQPFHCQRAIYLARAHGLDAIGFAAREVSIKHRLRRNLREPLACAKAWLDVHVLHARPHFEY